MINNQTLNINIYFGDDLKDYPENTKDLRLFVELESLEIQKLSGIEKYKAISRLAVNYRQLQNYQEAHKLFQIASEHFEMHHPLLEMINSLRWADVFRFENRFNEAWTLLEKTQKLISFHQISDYKDFYLQHLGKFYPHPQINTAKIFQTIDPSWI